MLASSLDKGMTFILPNLMTVSRIALVPVFALVYVFTKEHHFVAGLLFAVAALTDWLDGYLARRIGAQTKFGEFLDPVADKLIVTVALVLLVGLYGSLWLTIPGVIIIAREVLISALREWMAEINRRGLVSVTWMTKTKTMVQMIAIFVLMCNPPALPHPWAIVGTILLYVATGMTLWSMALYIKASWGSLRDGFSS